jgi:hypothetical protein
MFGLLRKAVEYVKKNAKFEWYNDEDYEEMFARSRKRRRRSYVFSSSFEDSFSDSHSDSPSVNPTTGLPMAGGVDIGGNPYGT